MRKLSSILNFKSLILMLLLVLGIGCETERLVFNGPYHVRFTESSVTFKESYSLPIKIEVHIAGPVPTEDMVVNYTISGNARENVDYQINGTRGQVLIKKGQYFGNIELSLINNSNNIIRSQDVIFTLNRTSDSNIGVGQNEGGIGKTFTLTIQDDCILGGTYSGTRGAFSLPVKGIQITSSDCETYSLSNWNINIFNYPLDLGLTFIDNGDNTITIPSQDVDIALKGKGTVDPLTREINLIITFDDIPELGEVSIKFTPE